MTQPLQRFLAQGDALASLHHHAARLRRLQSVLERQLAPGLARTCNVANLKGDVLVVIARSGAAAARLKQLQPTLVRQFAAEGVALSSIQIKVGVSYAPPQPPPAEPRHISAPARSHLQRLHDALPEDAPLRASLERLIQHSREP